MVAVCEKNFNLHIFGRHLILIIMAAFLLIFSSQKQYLVFNRAWYSPFFCFFLWSILPLRELQEVHGKIYI